MSTLERMKERVAAATKGPWELVTFTQNNERIHSVSQAHGSAEICRPYAEADAELITHAPEVHARLIAVMEFLDSAEKFATRDNVPEDQMETARAWGVTSFGAGYDEAVREMKAMIGDVLG